MTSMMASAASKRTLWRVFVAVIVMATHPWTPTPTRGQDVKADTLLVTSLGPPGAGPDMLPQIFRMNADGSGRTPLLPRKTLAFDPVLSPDGRRIAFVGAADPDRRDRDPALALFVMNLDGSGRQRLAQREQHGEHLLALFEARLSRREFSANGKRLLTAEDTVARLSDAASGKEIRSFGQPAPPTATTGPSPSSVYAIDADGRNLRRLTSGTDHVYLGGNYLFATQILSR